MTVYYEKAVFGIDDDNDIIISMEIFLLCYNILIDNVSVRDN